MSIARRQLTSSKSLHLHAIPVIVTILALTFLVAGMFALSDKGVANSEVGRALTRKAIILTPGTDGKVHFGLARAVSRKPAQPIRTAPKVADAQVGLSAGFQQTLDQIVTNSSY